MAAKNLSPTGSDRYELLDAWSFLLEEQKTDLLAQIKQCAAHNKSVVEHFAAERERQPIRKGQRRSADLIVLDFTAYDVLDELDALREMVLSGKVTGLVFAASMRGEPYKFGATGRLDNYAQAVVAAGMLQHECMENLRVGA